MPPWASSPSAQRIRGTKSHENLSGALSGSPNVHEYDDGARTTGGLLGGMRRGRAGAADEDDDEDDDDDDDEDEDEDED